MKFFVFALMVLSNVSLATTYQGSFATENLGTLKLDLDVQFVKGKTSTTINSYFRDQIDNGQWGDWICENKVNFKESLVIKGTVSRSTGEVIGSISSDRYDQRKGSVTLNLVETAPEEFNCELLSLKHVRAVYFEGYDALIKIGKFTLNFTVRGSEVPATHTELSNHTYRLEHIQTDSVIQGSRDKIQWSLNVDHGSYSNNYEWGFVGLKAL